MLNVHLMNLWMHFKLLKKPYKALEVKHGDFTMFLSNSEYDEAEQWT